VKNTISTLSVIALGGLFSGTALADCKGVHGRGEARQSAVVRFENVADNESAESAKGSIVGLWHIKFYSGGNLVDEGFDAWQADGTEILNDTPAPSTGNVCLGVWEKKGQTIHLKHPSWTFDNNGVLNGTAVIKETVQLLPGGNNFGGTFTIDVFDLNGKLQLHIDGTVTASRITPD
jgi:hypothetical protein